MSNLFETPPQFAKRTSIDYKIILGMVRQGTLPFIKTGKKGVRISVDGGIKALEKLSLDNAKDLATQMPAPLKLIPRTERKNKGRLPDKIRLAQKTAK